MQLLTTLDTNYMTCRGTQVLIALYLAHLPYFILRLYRITQETVSLKRHKLCVLPLKMCIKSLNDLLFAHSSIIRNRGDHNIPWSRHNISIASQKDTN
jgi:ABC-type antimicrobial peptide transport system permease subunit